MRVVTGGMIFLSCALLHTMYMGMPVHEEQFLTPILTPVPFFTGKSCKFYHNWPTSWRPKAGSFFVVVVVSEVEANKNECFQTKTENKLEEQSILTSI